MSSISEQPPSCEPRTWREFPELWNRLFEMRRTGRIAHAYLLTGDDEELLEETARLWSQTIACQDPRDDGRPCRNCAACKGFAGGHYRELYELRPVSRSRQILVDDMRDFEHQMSLTAAAGYRKIGVVVEADRLNDQAQNAFLKTLEEPPGKLVLLLLSTAPQRLLPTIRSRCQQISLRINRMAFGILDDVDVSALLAKLQRGAGAAVALQCAAGLRTAFGELQRMAESAESDPDEDVQALADQDTALKKRLQEQRDAKIQSEYLHLRIQLCAAIETWFHQRYLLAKGAAAEDLPNPELAPPSGMAAAIDPLAAEADFLEAGRLTRYLDGNVDEALALEAFCLNVCRKVHNSPKMR